MNVPTEELFGSIEINDSRKVLNFKTSFITTYVKL
jgi:hypothetical protein